MNKIGLILDSASGYTEKEIKDRGHAFIPLQITINGKGFKAGVDMVSDDIYKAMEDKSIDIKTSSPLGEDIEKGFDDILTKYDKAIYISLSKNMSGTNNAARMIAETDKYKGKIFVYDSEYSSPWLHIYLNCFEELLKENDNLDEIYKILDLANPYMFAQISPGNIYWFYKGGRITKMQYIAGSLLKLNPILTIEDGNISQEKVEKVRGSVKSMKRIIENFKPVFEDVKSKLLEYTIMIMDSSVKEFTTDMEELVHQEFNVPKEEISKQAVSPEQIAHMGPGSFGMGLFIKLKELQKAKAEGRI